MLAEALLAEGVLQERDWCGAIGPSIALGITRWVSNLLTGDPTALIRTMPEWCGEMLGGDLERIEIGLLWTDDLHSVSGIDTRRWTSAPGRNPQEHVGVLALVGEPVDGDRYPGERDVIVGRTVQEFEAVRPGLGFQVLYLLQEILPRVLCVATPHWALRQTCKAAFASGLRPGEIPGTNFNLVMPEHGVLPREFLQVVPLQACEGEFRPGVLKAALRDDPLPEELRPILAAAVEVYELSRIPQDAYRWDTHTLCAPKALTFIDVPGGAAPRTPFALRWSSADDLPALVDDYHHSTAKDATNLTWAQAWQASNPKALRRTARNFRRVATLAFKACQLAELMHSDEDPQ